MTRQQRGTSIPEVLTVTVIIGMLLSAMVVIVPILAKSPLQMQAQVDEVNTAAIALYKMRRDFAEGDTTGIMGCSTTPVVVCSAPPGGGATISVGALAVPTAEDASGHFQVDPQGNPYWQGFYVYWLVPNATGTSYDLLRAWEPNPSIWVLGQTAPVGVTAAMVQLDVTLAMLISPPPVLANNIATMKIGDDLTKSTVDFSLIAGTTGGVDSGRTTFAGNTYARN